MKILNKNTFSCRHAGAGLAEIGDPVVKDKLNHLKCSLEEFPKIVKEFQELVELNENTTCAISATKIGYDIENLRFTILNTIFGKGAAYQEYERLMGMGARTKKKKEREIPFLW